MGLFDALMGKRYKDPDGFLATKQDATRRWKNYDESHKVSPAVKEIQDRYTKKGYRNTGMYWVKK